jgi:uncharacterized protein DUF5335
MKTREIPKEDWGKFFDNFSRRHEGWLVTLEILGTEIGAQIEERDLALKGIVDEWDEIKGNQIMIMVGMKTDDHLTHTISNATEVSVEQTEGGADVALAIKSADGITALIRFISPVLPETVDGVVAQPSRRPLGRTQAH